MPFGGGVIDMAGKQRAVHGPSAMAKSTEMTLALVSERLTGEDEIGIAVRVVRDEGVRDIKGRKGAN